MAEGTARTRIDERYPNRASELTVSSAGVAGLDGETATMEAVMTMRERGVDITAHRAKSVTPELLVSSDLVLTMEARQMERVRAMAAQPVTTAPEPGESDDRPSFPMVFPLLRLGEAARRASREQDDAMQPTDLSARLERLVRTADAIRREDSWEFPDFTYEIGDPMGLSISRYSSAAEAMEGPIHEILSFLLS